MAYGGRFTAAALLALLALSACGPAAGRSLGEEEAPEDADVLESQEITRDDSDLIDIICGFNDGVSSRTIEDFLLTNVTNPELVEVLAREQQVYNWAEPQLDDMEWLCKMMREFNSEREEAAVNGKPLELLWYGDAVLQCMRFPGGGCEGAQDVYQKEWGSKYRSADWALGGDTTASLMWRILNGNAPESTAKTIVLQVGTQDLMQTSQDPETWDTAMKAVASRIISIADYLKNQTKDAQVLLLGLLPLTGYNSKGNPTMKISQIYRDGIDSVNKMLREYGLAEKRVNYIDCIDKFTNRKGGQTINEKYFTGDNVPTGRGFEELAECINPFIKDHMNREH